jgi:hypothetical protein
MITLSLFLQFLQGFGAKIDGRKEALGPGVLGATHACSKLVKINET